MASLLVFYATGSGTRFDRDYYSVHHAAKVHAAWNNAGLVRMDILYGEPGRDGSEPPFHAIATLTFATAADLAGIDALPATAELFADAPNYTNVKPTVMIASAG